MATTPVLSAPIGPNQPNRPEDVALVREYLNAFISVGHLPGLSPLPATGPWDAQLEQALQNVENKFFFGRADPDNKLETNDTLFRFLVNADLTQKEIASTLSAETYQLV